MRRLTLAAVAAVMVLVWVPSAQQKVSKRRAVQGFVLGRVVDAQSNQPVAGATVTIETTGGGRGGPASVSVIATGTGDFLLRDVSAGTYNITVTAPGYLPGGFGQRRPGGPIAPRAFAEGERTGDVTIRLWREATIAGVVRDDQGEPVGQITVTLLDREQLEPAAGLRDNARAGARFAFADAAGAFQFTGLLPGDYVISIPSRTAQIPALMADAGPDILDLARASGFSAFASGMRGLGPVMRLGDVLVATAPVGQSGGSNSPIGLLPATIGADGTVTAYAATFYPGVLDPASAAAIRLAAGERRTGADIRMMPVKTHRVSGRIESPEGPLPGLAVHLIPRFAADSELERTHEAALTLAGAGGAFVFVGVPPGDYVLKAWRLTPSSVIGTDALPATPTLWARQPVVVRDEAVSGLRVVVRPGSTIRGRIVQEGTATPLPASRLQTVVSVAFEPAWRLAFGARLATRVSPAMEFATHGLPPGEYFVVLPNQFAPAATGWFFESVRRHGRDLLMEPLVLEAGVDIDDVTITFSDRRTMMSGRVTDASGQPSATAGVVMFPIDVDAWIARGLPPLASWAETASSSGTFAFDARPGEYLIAAIDEARLAEWRRAEIVKALAVRATRVTLTRGETGRVDLRVLAVPAAGGR